MKIEITAWFVFNNVTQLYRLTTALKCHVTCAVANTFINKVALVCQHEPAKFFCIDI